MYTEGETGIINELVRDHSFGQQEAEFAVRLIRFAVLVLIENGYTYEQVEGKILDLCYSVINSTKYYFMKLEKMEPFTFIFTFDGYDYSCDLRPQYVN